MPRKGHVARRDVPEDPIYKSKLVTKLINKLMYDGKKSVAQKACYGAFEIIREKTGKDPLEVFQEALKNVMPVLEVRPRRVGGATYQVPIEVPEHRRLSLGIRWLVEYARQRTDKKTIREKLAAEIMDAANGTGGAVKKKDETHRMAEANRAFAHYRW
ncbi:30S ribosomal protein S7 [Thermosediminibacter oceani]|uniref:Small ribosomal subunit protein uS7 n=1 Tax=Thermosediminibacter oceani (strain ATCC BAA-1034 / DSM 16646 / JW/IW-1228P) TaxID=555079 RepID=D9RZK8_THEOJ|nr:30S ribosomal protein S7 [Thermosediminibacter oceani]ADL06906.1 SSU ribosomal protein S7P [Thermosediminibacter oceani DSM 16646]